jgi:Bacterial regulatory proteins, gntR family
MLSNETAAGSEGLVPRITDELPRRILVGSLPSGERLRQDALAYAFGVGQGTVREAFRKLDWMKLAEAPARRARNADRCRARACATASTAATVGLEISTVCPLARRGYVRTAFEKHIVVIPTGFEPVAYSLGNCRSILLSYGTTGPAIAHAGANRKPQASARRRGRKGNGATGIPSATRSAASRRLVSP